MEPVTKALRHARRARRYLEGVIPMPEKSLEELDAKADRIIAIYAVITGAWNILPPPLDMVAVTGTFTKMATELSGVYGVALPGSRARAIGWAIATSTASVLGVTYAGSKLIRLIPYTGWILGLLVQGPIVGAVAWAAGEALKDYFGKARAGVDLSISELTDSFVGGLKARLTRVKDVEVVKDAKPAPNGKEAPATATPEPIVAEYSPAARIRELHNLFEAGILTKDEFEAKKADILSRI
jgi:uncharacterized protein (DUF697 family)